MCPVEDLSNLLNCSAKLILSGFVPIQSTLLIFIQSAIIVVKYSQAGEKNNNVIGVTSKFFSILTNHLSSFYRLKICQIDSMQSLMYFICKI